MTGEIIYNWKVIKRDESKSGTVFWICECQCENKTIRSVSGINLRSGKSKSCGCLHNKHKSNIYDLSGDFGIGYTIKDEKFFFDLEDYNLLKDYYWYINSQGYPCTRRNGVDILMHRLILDVSENDSVDHIEHNTYDNRKEKMRVVTHDKNMLNKNVYKNNTSGYHGVTWNKRDQKWVVRIQINKSQVELGRFNDKDVAVSVRKDAEKEYYGEFRNKLNQLYQGD